MKRILLLVILALSLTGCYNGNDARNALEAQGFTDIEITGHSWIACSEDDFYNTGFVATNPQGKRVKGTVCSGFLFKNSTVRW